MVSLERCESLHGVRVLGELVQRRFGLRLGLATAAGVPIEHEDDRVMAAPCGICKIALFSRPGFKACNQSYRAARAADNGAARSRCHMGLGILSVPARVRQEVVAHVFTSGFVPAPPDEEARAAIATRTGVLTESPADLEAALRSVPIVAPERMGELQELLDLAAAEVASFLAERMAAAKRVTPEPTFEGILGRSAPMQALYRVLEKVVQSESTVLVLGESGTGKELVARAIHTRGPRKNKAFVAQNCSALTDTLLESAMFGYVRGAFTGAVKDTKGLFEVSDGGTFFLDEVGDMSPSLQVKLLRVLQDGTFTPVGGTTERRANVRVVAATNKDLQAAVQNGEFREDLFYRLNVIRINMPPLRDREGDVALLVDFFLARHNKQRGAQPLRLSRAVQQALEDYHWPGNVRELENEIERLVVLGSGEDEIDVDLLSPRLQEIAREARPSQSPAPRQVAGSSLRQALEDLERQILREGLERTNGNKSQLAKELGISRSNLIAKVQQYGLG
ncbi:MAG: sigma 54-interacting transcriptional regulator [Micrococcales bacterium]|nr:sigma 54-interacting transcriptional regulator [Micrococcales bacterium]